MVKKLKYLLFLLPFLFIDNVYANTYQLTFSSLVGAGNTYSIVSNNNQSISYDVPFSGNVTNYEWTTTNSPTCSSTAVVSGIVYIDNTNFGVNNDDVSWGRVYIRANSSSGATNCTIQVADSGTRYVCTSPSLSSNFIIGYTLNSSTPQLPLNHVITRNVDINCDTSTGQIIDNQNANTQNIINNNTQNSQNIINNQNSNTNQIIQDNQQNTQDIINNQNQNTQNQINSQNEIFGNICYNNLLNINENYSFSGNPTIPINIPAGTYYLTNQSALNSVDTNEVFVRFNNNNIRYNLSDNKNIVVTFTTDETAMTLYSKTNAGGSAGVSAIIQQLMISNEPNVPYTPYGEKKCINKLDDQTNAINDLNESITSEDSPNTNQDISDMNDMIASDTPITDLLTLPMTLINAYYTGITSSCSPYNFGSLLGTDIIFPCINLEQTLGSNLWLIIDSLCSIFLIYSIAMLFVHAFDSLTSLKDDFDDMYVPRHAGKHVGSGING